MLCRNYLFFMLYPGTGVNKEVHLCNHTAAVSMCVSWRLVHGDFLLLKLVSDMVVLQLATLHD